MPIVLYVNNGFYVVACLKLHVNFIVLQLSSNEVAAILVHSS